MPDPPAPTSAARARPKDRVRSLRTILWVALAGTVVRAVWAVALSQKPTGLSDPFVYWGYGIRIANGNGYSSIIDEPTAYFPPGYPFFLGGIYRLTDVVGISEYPVWPVGLAQALLWGVAIVAVGIAARAAFGQRAGVTAAVVLAVWPNLVSYAGALLSESLFVALFAVVVAGTTLLARWWSGDRHAPGGGQPTAAPGSSAVVALVVAGTALCLALATTVRPQVLLSLPALLVAWSVSGLGWRRTGMVAGAAAVALLVVVTPWAVRNHEVFGHVVPISTNTGDNLCVGFHPGALGGFSIPEHCDTGEFWTDGPDAEFRRDRDTRELAFEFIREEPGALPWLSARKLWNTYRADDDGLAGMEAYGADDVIGGLRPAWTVLANTAYAMVMTLFVAGVVATRRQWWSRRPDAVVLGLLAMTVVGVLVPVLFFGDPRFKVPTTPLFALFAAAGLGWVTDRVRTRSAAR